MSSEIIESLRTLIDTSGSLYKNYGSDTKNRYKKFKEIICDNFPASFEIVPFHGNPYADRGGNNGQTIKNYFWITAKHKNITDENNPVSLSSFLSKDDNGNPIIRLSVEIKTRPEQRTKKNNQTGLKDVFFKYRPNYVKALSIQLMPGLTYWYNGKKNVKIDQKIVDSFVSNINSNAHIEIAKVIELDDLYDDEDLNELIKKGFENLEPYYEVATGENNVEDVLDKYPSLSKISGNGSINQKKEDLIFPKNVILFGPPGTGKTYHSIAYAEAIVENNQSILEQLKNHEIISDYGDLKENFNNDLVEYDAEGKVKKGHICFTTFHQSYSYEDFIEGIFPDVSQETGDIKYILRPGVFKSLCDYAKQHPNDNFVIIIDEINRGNVSKIFGDLITLIEEDKRIHEKNELQVILPYSKEQWGVPYNVYIIGTMNTADRSIERLDTALRRRFAFFEMMPNPTLLESYKNCLVSKTDTNPLSLKDVLSAINERITYIYDRDHQIGHSYFLDIPELENGSYNLDDLSKVFKNKIIPLLQEYFYGNYQKIRFVLGITGKENNDQDMIVRRKAKYTYVAQNEDLLDDIDDEEESYEINDDGFNDINNYLKIIGLFPKKSFLKTSNDKNEDSEN